MTPSRSLLYTACIIHRIRSHDTFQVIVIHSVYHTYNKISWHLPGHCYTACIIHTIRSHDTFQLGSVIGVYRHFQPGQALEDVGPNVVFWKYCSVVCTWTAESRYVRCGSFKREVQLGAIDPIGLRPALHSMFQLYCDHQTC